MLDEQTTAEEQRWNTGWAASPSFTRCAREGSSCWVATDVKTRLGTQFPDAGPGAGRDDQHNALKLR